MTTFLSPAPANGAAPPADDLLGALHAARRRFLASAAVRKWREAVAARDALDGPLAEARALVERRRQELNALVRADRDSRGDGTVRDARAAYDEAQRVEAPLAHEREQRHNHACDLEVKALEGLRSALEAERDRYLADVYRRAELARDEATRAKLSGVAFVNDVLLFGLGDPGAP